MCVLSIKCPSEKSLEIYGAAPYIYISKIGSFIRRICCEKKKMERKNTYKWMRKSFSKY